MLTKTTQTRNTLQALPPLNHQLQRAPPTTLQSQKQQHMTILFQKINKLTSRVDFLEGRVTQLQAEISISSQVNTVLEAQLDDLQQYQRRSCMIVDGIKPTIKETTEDLMMKIRKAVTEKLIDEKGIDSNNPLSTKDFNDNSDKCHRIGPIRDGKQAAIIKFKSHSFREKAYELQKKIKTSGIRFRVSLTNQRVKLLEKANGLVSDHLYNYENLIKFAYADANGNLRFLLNKRFKGKWTYKFTSEPDMMNLLSKFSNGEDDGTTNKLYNDFSDDIGL